MSSNGTGFRLRSTLAAVDDSTDGSSPMGDVTRLQPVRSVADDPETSLTQAGAAMARVEREIDQLWCDSMQTDDRAISQRLAELSHALHRAAHLLQNDDAIG